MKHSRAIRRRRLPHHLARAGPLLLLALLLVAGVRAYVAFRDRAPGYALDLSVEGRESSTRASPLRAGFARVNINLDLSDPQRPGGCLDNAWTSRPHARPSCSSSKWARISEDEDEAQCAIPNTLLVHGFRASRAVVLARSRTPN